MGQWFAEAGGKAALAQQLQGLEALWPVVSGNSVLDVGCAEGLITHECIQRGALFARGIDNRSDAIAEARRRYRDVPLLAFECADAATWSPADALPKYDVVLLLAVLHKLRDPCGALARYLAACRRLAVVRLPEGQWPHLIDSRSGGKRQNLGVIAELARFELQSELQGPHGQWVGYLVRQQHDRLRTTQLNMDRDRMWADYGIPGA